MSTRINQRISNAVKLTALAGALWVVKEKGHSEPKMRAAAQYEIPSTGETPTELSAGEHIGRLYETNLDSITRLGMRIERSEEVIQNGIATHAEIYGSNEDADIYIVNVSCRQFPLFLKDNELGVTYFLNTEGKVIQKVNHVDDFDLETKLFKAVANACNK